MSKTKGFKAEKNFAEKIACGRSFEDQINDIENYGNHGVSELLRNEVLAAHGIANPKKSAEYGLIFGCYRPFNTPYLLQDYIKLLDILNVDYTWFEKEYCCGLPLVTEDLEKGHIQGTRFARKNLELAKEASVKKLFYCCVGCAYAAKQAAEDSTDFHGYILDLILDNIKETTCKTSPVRLGYFEGCHTFYKAHYPNANLDWPRYREILDSLDGLSIVDLPNKLCCKQSAEKIIQKALENNLDKVLCPCNGCYRALKAAARGRLDVITYPELLLEYLGNGVV